MHVRKKKLKSNTIYPRNSRGTKYYNKEGTEQ